MIIRQWLCLYTLAVFLAACGAGTAASPTNTALPPTNTALPPTNTALPPTNTALPPTNTALPPTNTAMPTPVGQRAVTFKAGDGTELRGTLYGDGDTAIVLSNMGDNDPVPWQDFAPQLAAKGYRVLTYAYRYPKNASDFTTLRAQQTLDDLRAAIAFVRAEGAQRLALVGASLGGMVTAKAAADAKPNVVVVLAAPIDLPEFNFRVEPAELQALDMPKLFISSEQDGTVPFAETQHMHDLVPEPKELQSYPGTAHGVQLFTGPSALDLGRRLIDFITAHMPLQ